jgi:cell division transport system ATP-binding protein
VTDPDVRNSADPATVAPQPTAPSMIRFVDVSKRWSGGRDGVNEISFAVDGGEMLFVTGHSGAGKSTVLRLVSGAERATRGQVLVAGRDVAKLRARDMPSFRRAIGQVFQDHRLLADRSIAANVALPLAIAGLPRAEIDKRVRVALDKVGLGERSAALPEELSAGEQQRVGIARAVAPKPSLLIADEPTGNLDPQLAQEVMTLFLTLAEVGTTVLVASHDLHLIRRMRRRVLVLERGRLIDDFRPEPVR